MIANRRRNRSLKWRSRERTGKEHKSNEPQMDRHERRFTEGNEANEGEHKGITARQSGNQRDEEAEKEKEYDYVS